MTKKADVSGNWLSKEGAISLARKIEKYWLERGYPVTTTIEVVPRQSAGFEGVLSHGEAAHQVRSDMVNGFPRARAEARGKASSVLGISVH